MARSQKEAIIDWAKACLSLVGAEVVDAGEDSWDVRLHEGPYQGWQACRSVDDLRILADEVNERRLAAPAPKRGSKRTDIHRPGAIIPANYRYIMSYYMGGMMAPSIRVDCTRPDWQDLKKEPKHGAYDDCCVRRLQDSGAKFARNIYPGKCSICGANFRDGDVWFHEPSGEYIHLGRDCAMKYELLADRSAHELELGRMQKAKATQVQREMNEEARRAFLNEHPGLEEALKVQHQIIESIRARFMRETAITDKQVALVMKIAHEVRNPKPKVEEQKAEAPTGRVTFRGVVVSQKTVESDWGLTCKITVKVTTPQGIWLAWGTMPRSIRHEVHGRPHAAGEETLKGAEVEITATLALGNEKHFAFMKRPNGKVIAWPDASAT